MPSVYILLEWLVEFTKLYEVYWKDGKVDIKKPTLIVGIQPIWNQSGYVSSSLKNDKDCLLLWEQKEDICILLQFWTTMSSYYYKLGGT